ncbi:hypothetical protein L6452_07270 [Arctium lappa]|uniref:Uncharacterized protein n=1 Tax=Arctium lappa TaxID=4217 RepID=A0ACB9EKB9_ARCLA|nr:hypothetical protein L6452_07270 [Arctium lappa]
MMMMSYLIYILPFFFTFFYLFKSTQPTTTTNPPPSPPKLPIIGNLHQLGPLIHRSFSSLSQRYGGGHLMLLHLGSAPSLVVSSAAAAQEIMQTHDLIFSTRPPIQMHKTLFYDLKEIAAAPYGEYWRQAKKLIILNFLSSKKVQTFSRVREEEIAITISKVAKISESNKAVNLGDLLFEFSNGVSCRATFGKKYDKESGKKLKRVVSKMFEILPHFFYADLIPQLAWIDQISGANGKVEAVAKDVDEFMEVAIEERLAGRKQTDDHEVGEGVEPFIDALLRIQKDGVDGISFNRDNVKALLLDSYVGATETSSSVLEWVMAELLTHPQALEKVQAEVNDT